MAQQPAAGGGLLVMVATGSRLYVLTGGATLEAVFACFSDGPGVLIIHFVCVVQQSHTTVCNNLIPLCAIRSLSLDLATDLLPHISAEVEVPMSVMALWTPPGLPAAQRLAWANGGGLLLADIATTEQPEGIGV